MFSKMSNIPEWGFVSGRISVLEAGFLPREFFLSMIGQENVDDVVRNLQDTFLKEHLAAGSISDELDTVFDRCFYDMALSLRNNCPSTIPADIFMLKNDYLNMKTALSGKNTFYLTTEYFTHEKLLAIAQGNYAELPPALREPAVLAAGETLQTDEYILDIILDGSYLRHLLLLSKEIKSHMIGKYINEMVLAYAVMVLWRAVNQGVSLKRYQQYLLPLGDFTHVVDELIGTNNLEMWPAIIGGEIGVLFNESFDADEDEQISVFELKVSNYLGKIARDGRYQTAGPERVFAFLAGFLTEMQNLKLVVTGRLNRIDKHLLRERLKDCYV